MFAEITTVERQESLALTIKDTVGTMKLGKVIGPAYGSILSYMTENKIDCSQDNIPFCIYQDLNWNELSKTGPIAMFKMIFLHKWHLEMGIPCDRPLPNKPPINSSRLPSGTFLRTIHKGPYMKVGEAYKRIQAEARSKGISLKNFSIEFYLNDPRVVKSEQLETEVLVPIKA